MPGSQDTRPQLETLLTAAVQPTGLSGHGPIPPKPTSPALRTTSTVQWIWRANLKRTMPEED